MTDEARTAFEAWVQDDDPYGLRSSGKASERYATFLAGRASLEGEVEHELKYETGFNDAHAAADSRVKQAERERDELREAKGVWQARCARARASGYAEGAEVIALILPLAKGYAAAHPCKSSARYIAKAEAALAAAPPTETGACPRCGAEYADGECANIDCPTNAPDRYAEGWEACRDFLVEAERSAILGVDDDSSEYVRALNDFIEWALALTPPEHTEER